MSNLRNKKRLTALVLAFLMVFVVGAAFALTPGALTVAGTISLDPPDVRLIWELDDTASDYVNTSGTVDYVINVNEVDAASTDSAIIWNVSFMQPGTATLNLAVTNQSPTTIARIESVDITPLGGLLDGSGPGNWADGFTLGGTATTGVAAGLAPTALVAADTTRSAGTVTVTWDGTFPDGVFEAGGALYGRDGAAYTEDALNNDPQGVEFASFLITFNYVAN